VGSSLVVGPHLVKNLIKPHIVGNALVTVIATSTGKKEELKRAYNILVDHKVKDAAMCERMVRRLPIYGLLLTCSQLHILCHIGTFDPKATSIRYYRHIGSSQR
jgi:hypothetical protein